MCVYRAVSGVLVFDEPVNVVLGSVFAGGHLKHKGNAQQSLLSFSVGHNLKEGKRAQSVRTQNTN